jgi:hypothetical protein
MVFVSTPVKYYSFKILRVFEVFTKTAVRLLAPVFFSVLCSLYHAKLIRSQLAACYQRTTIFVCFSYRFVLPCLFIVEYLVSNFHQY